MFEILSICPATEIKPATSCSTVKRSTYWANPRGLAPKTPRAQKNGRHVLTYWGSFVKKIKEYKQDLKVKQFQEKISLY